MTVVLSAPDRLSRSAGQSTLALFGITLGAGAVLMFLLEPMAAKMVLPSLGGAPAVWNTCVVFFQCMLLAGYAYAYAGRRWLSVGRHAAIHLVLLFVSALTLLSPPRIDEVPGDSSPIAGLLLALLKGIGLPFFLLATTTPLLQEWFSRTRHRAARDPYFLYAASNVGSLAGLLMYPLAVEPFLQLRVQASYWTYGYMGFVVLVAACAAILRRGQHVEIEDARPAAGDGPEAAPTSSQRFRWLVLSLAPSSLMLAVTTFISTDVAAVPLLWVVPLALYLLTFILAFGSRPRYPRGVVDRGLPLLVLGVILFLIFQIRQPLVVVVPIQLGVFFLAALDCHRQLADERPHTAYLTEFYFLVALGGVLGSLFNTLLAPILFTGIVEYPAVLLLVCLLRAIPDTHAGISRAWRVGGPVVVTVAAAGLMVASSRIDSVALRFALVSVPAFICLRLARTRLPFAAAIAGLLAASLLQADPVGRLLYAERTFFGTYKVHQDPTAKYRKLTHGTTLHGIQSVSADRRLEALSYYHSTGPLGDLFRLSAVAPVARRIGVVGLGVGSVAAYRRPEQTWTFFEIDPAVERIARDQSYFSYLADCGEACHVVIGDARQSLRRAPDQFEILVLDAFSSDAIPLHLVTREAIDLYLSRLGGGGLLAFHISNRHLNLEPVLAKLAARAGLVVVIRRDREAANAPSEKASSDWIVMARKAADLGRLASDPAWRTAQYTASTDLWTDDFSNIVKLLMHR